MKNMFPWFLPWLSTGTEEPKNPTTPVALSLLMLPRRWVPLQRRLPSFLQQLVEWEKTDMNDPQQISFVCWDITNRLYMIMISPLIDNIIWEYLGYQWLFMMILSNHPFLGYQSYWPIPKLVQQSGVHQSYDPKDIPAVENGKISLLPHPGNPNCLLGCTSSELESGR